MKKSELKEIIKSEFLTEKKDSKKGNENEQKRMEGAIRDDRDHIKNLKKDIEANEKKLARLKKDYKRDVVKENTINEEPVSAAVVAAGVASIFGGSVLIDKLMDKAEDGDFGRKGEEVAAFLRKQGKAAANRYSEGIEEEMDKDDMDEAMRGGSAYEEDDIDEMMRGSAYEEDDTMREEEDMDEMMRGSAYEEDDTMREAEEVDVEDDVDVDVDVEDDIEVDDVSDKSEIEVDSELAGESGDTAAVLGLLTKAQEKASDMGDEKLMDQIGNTITYYTRAHVVAEVKKEDDDVKEEMKDKKKVKKELNEEFARFQKLAGLIK